MGGAIRFTVCIQISLDNSQEGAERIAGGQGWRGQPSSDEADWERW
jgi:hypothetical protein